MEGVTLFVPSSLLLNRLRFIGGTAVPDLHPAQLRFKLLLEPKREVLQLSKKERSLERIITVT